MTSKRSELILDFISKNPDSGRQEIQDFLAQAGEPVTKISLVRELNNLIEQNLIKKSGKARATVYQAAAPSELFDEIDVDAYFETDPDQRLLKNEKFNFGIWKHLKDLLTSEEKSEYQALNQKYRDKKSKLSPTILHKELERLTIELAWKSSKIEGNTYTLLDTERLLKENVSAQGKTHSEAQMIINHKKALDFIIDQPEYYRELSIAKIEDIHRLLVDGLEVSQGVRQNTVGIVGTNYKPLDNAFQIKEALRELIEVINRTENPLEKALIAVLMIAYIQPFEDGNKRTSRILGNALLLAHGYCPLSYRSVDEVEYKKGVILFYEQNNAAYFKKLFLEQFRQAVEKYF